MLKVQEFIGIVDELVPFSLAESWDNVGLLLGSAKAGADRVLVALEASEKVVQEACAEGYDVLLTHHPLFLRPLSRVTDESRIGKAVLELLRDEVALIAAHTNLDVASGGLCDIAAREMGLGDTRPLERAPAGWQKLVGFIPQDHVEAVAAAVFSVGAGRIGEYEGCAFRSTGQGSFLPGEGADPYVGEVGRAELVPEIRWEVVVPEGRMAAAAEAFIAAHPYEEPAFDIYPLENLRTDAGAGRVGRLSERLTMAQLADRVAEAVGLDAVRLTGDPGRAVETAAVVTGSGASYIPSAARSADVLVTGDLKHHDADAAGDRGIGLIDVPHGAFESWAMRRWCDVLRDRLGDSGAVVRYSRETESPWKEQPSRGKRRSGGEPTASAAAPVGMSLFPEQTDALFHLWTDGGSRGNPGPSAIGVVLEDDRRNLVEEHGGRIGEATNNVAEYQALITGLETALDRGVRRLRIHSDSELVVKQLRGVYRVKNEQLKPLYERARSLVQKFDEAEVTHIPRGENSRADELVNRALDDEQGP